MQIKQDEISNTTMCPTLLAITLNDSRIISLNVTNVCIAHGKSVNG